MNADPTHDSTNSAKEFYKAIDNKARRILKHDPCFQYRQAVKKGVQSGLIRKKTDIEIHNEVLKKPWIKVNEIIKNNEHQ